MEEEHVQQNDVSPFIKKYFGPLIFQKSGYKSWMAQYSTQQLHIEWMAKKKGYSKNNKYTKFVINLSVTLYIQQ